MSIKEFVSQITHKGYYSFPDFVGSILIERMKIGLEESYVRCREIQIKNQLDHTEGTVHHLIGQDQSFMDYLTKFEELNCYVEAYFGGKYILNSFGGNILRKGSSYANNIHRDIRSYSKDIPLMLNTILFLDDFTKDNGATWIMPRGHNLSTKPCQEEFNEYKIQITGKAGTVYMWNSNLWHQAGENKTDSPRRSVTPEFTKPFIKQGMDYPRVLGFHMGDLLSPHLKQVLGFNSRTPTNLDNWYQPESKRFYKADQG